jgi:hypothetical protein
MAYEPKLPEGVSLPPGLRVNVDDERYKALHALAEREKWSQAAFSDVLGIEARRVSAEHAKAAQTSVPAAPPAPSPDFSKMTTQEKFAHALAQSDAKRAAGGKP